MIKFKIGNFFKDEVTEETPTLEIDVDVPVEIRKEKFDKAVADQTRSLLKEDLDKALFIVVYGQEVYDDTVGLRSCGGSNSYKEAVDKYPKARIKLGYARWDACLDLEISDLLDYLANEALGETNDN